MNNKLTSKFIIELFAVCLSKRTVMDTVRQFLSYSFLQSEDEKELWKSVTETYNKTGRIPTIGQLQQKFATGKKLGNAVLDLLEEVADVEIDDGDEEDILDAFEKFIKQMKFLEANDLMADAYNKGDKDKAYNILVKSAEDIQNFSIRGQSFETVFADFSARQAHRRSPDYNRRFKVPTGIDELDYRLGGANGGPESGECVLWLGDSGMGKSQLLVSLGITAARLGFRVAHFQLEGTKDQCLNRYDAAWTGTLYSEMKTGNISTSKEKALTRIVSKLSKNDIIVSSEESFNSKTIPMIRKELKEMEKTYGKIDVILIDYLELSEPGDGIKYGPKDERFRQGKMAKQIKMLAMEFNAVVHTATQSSSIEEEERNDPNFVLTRSNLSEDKGKIRPFDIFVTLNQTYDERREEVMRLNTDKLREYANGAPIHICNNFAYARFYDRKKTLNYDWGDDED